MKCPSCQSMSLKTIDSRKSTSVNTTKRRKECCNCTNRFSTVESIIKPRPDVIIKPKIYSINQIKEVVSGYYGFPVTSLEGQKKSDPESVAKYASYYISFILTEKSGKIIAEHHGSKHQNSVYFGIKKIKDLMIINEDVKFDIDFIIKLIKSI